MKRSGRRLLECAKSLSMGNILRISACFSGSGGSVSADNLAPIGRTDKRSLAVLLLSVLPLSGCFKSATPLISVFDSVAPVPEGRYTYVDTNKATKSVIIAHDGGATKMITTKDDGSVKIDRLLMEELDKGCYIVMDARRCIVPAAAV